MPTWLVLSWGTPLTDCEGTVRSLDFHISNSTTSTSSTPSTPRFPPQRSLPQRSMISQLLQMKMLASQARTYSTSSTSNHFLRAGTFRNPGRSTIILWTYSSWCPRRSSYLDVVFSLIRFFGAGRVCSR
ncbi:hypothetical protein M758_5G056400 [Ceratodon purpureus]|nr:hypothetical protein M758_5G056400 [Ceratodon purpureus]